MAFKMAENSLFAVLLRSPWWDSFLIAAFFIAVSVILGGNTYVILGITAALPFIGIGIAAAVRQSKLPSQKRIVEIAELAQTLPAKDIASKISESYINAGFEIAEFKPNTAELALTRGYRKILLSTKRFKASNTGVGPLKDLVQSGEEVEATSYVFVALGTVSDAAVEYASENKIEIIRAAKLAEFFDGNVKLNFA